jgi:hypothetical protein
MKCCENDKIIDGAELLSESCNSRARIIATLVIEDVLDAIEREHPEVVGDMIKKYMLDIEEPAILSGSAYYNLEDKLTELIRPYL